MTTHELAAFLLAQADIPVAITNDGYEWYGTEEITELPKVVESRYGQIIAFDFGATKPF